MSDVSEETVRRWVKDQVQDTQNDRERYNNNRKAMFGEAMLTLIILAAIACVAFGLSLIKSDVEQCAASCGTAGMRSWTKALEVRLPAGQPDITVPPNCTCHEVKMP